ncbi:class I SAM-dependent methyltransferase [Hylemonella gracilis]|uniref:class I SAM-dependent methyltransferase n=1 Tax=Hylemonella gracilis TaxID=80880 RepID=UPI000684A80E|nr:class I SAM-dependent methyltransferase [Hylemonella gracilis]
MAPATACAPLAPSPLQPPSEWVRRWAHLVPMGHTAGTQDGQVLDLACGRGRHLRFFHERGHPVVGVDRDSMALANARAAVPPAQLIDADLENGPWPLSGQFFAGVVVTNYLWRALLPTIVSSVAPGGALIYETFARGNERHGKPSNPDFLLHPGELLAACAAGTPPLRVVAYEDVTLNDPMRCVQRVAAVRD